MVRLDQLDALRMSQSWKRQRRNRFFPTLFARHRLTWVSMSRMHILPPFLTSSTACTLVPYMLPLNSACSMNPSRLTRSTKSSRVTKWYETPCDSPGRGARVVSRNERGEDQPEDRKRSQRGVTHARLKSQTCPGSQ